MDFQKMFQEARAGAMADFASTPSTAAAPAATPVEASVEVEAPADATTEVVAASAPEAEAVGEAAVIVDDALAAADAPATTPAETLASTADETKKWQLKVGGQTVEVATEEELINLAQQGVDYTRKRMAESEAVREVQTKLTATEAKVATMEATRSKEVASMQQFLNDRELVRAYLNDLDAKAAATDNPDQPLTAAQVEAVTKQRVEEALKAERERQANETLAASVESQRKEYATTVASTIEAIKTEFPILAKKRNIDKVLIAEVAPQVQARIDANPDQVVPIGDVVNMLKAAAKAEVEELRSLMTPTQTKAKAAEANAAMKAASGAPKGAVTPAVKPVPAGQAAAKFKIGDPRLRQLALDDIKRLAGANGA